MTDHNPPKHPHPGACVCGHVHAIADATGQPMPSCTVSGCDCTSFAQDETATAEGSERDPWSSDPDAWKQ